MRITPYGSVTAQNNTRPTRAGPFLDAHEVRRQTSAMSTIDFNVAYSKKYVPNNTVHGIADAAYLRVAAVAVHHDGFRGETTRSPDRRGEPTKTHGADGRQSENGGGRAIFHLNQITTARAPRRGEGGRKMCRENRNCNARCNGPFNPKLLTRQVNRIAGAPHCSFFLFFFDSCETGAAATFYCTRTALPRIHSSGGGGGSCCRKLPLPTLLLLLLLYTSVITEWNRHGARERSEKKRKTRKQTL